MTSVIENSIDKTIMKSNAILDLAEARDLTEQVKADAAALWAKLLKLYEGKAHIALGYASWGEYCAEEFGMGNSHAYRVLDAARVVDALPDSPNGGTRTRLASIGAGAVQVEPSDGLPTSERVARELVPVLKSDGPEKVEQVWGEVVAEHGSEPTAAQVREFVASKGESFDAQLAASASTGLYSLARDVASRMLAECWQDFVASSFGLRYDYDDLAADGWLDGEPPEGLAEIVKSIIGNAETINSYIEELALEASPSAALDGLDLDLVPTDRCAEWIRDLRIAIEGAETVLARLERKS